MGTRVKKDRRADQRAALRIVREDNAKKEEVKQKNALTDKTNRSNVAAKTAVMKQRNRQTLANATNEKRDHLVDSNTPKQSRGQKVTPESVQDVRRIADQRAVDKIDKARLGEKGKGPGPAPGAGRKAPVVTTGGLGRGLAIGGAVAALGAAIGNRGEADSAADTWIDTGLIHNRAPKHVMDSVKADREARRAQGKSEVSGKQGKGAAGDKPKTPTPRPDNLAVSTVPAPRSAPKGGSKETPKGPAPTKAEVAKAAVEKGKTPSSTGARTAKPKQAEGTKSPAKSDGKFPVYKKGSAEAKDFRSAFAAARKSGASEFTWQGRKYNTKIKK